MDIFEALETISDLLDMLFSIGTLTKKEEKDCERAEATIKEYVKNKEGV